MSEVRFMYDPTQEGQRALKEKGKEIQEDKDRPVERTFRLDAKQMIIYDAIAHPKFDDGTE